MYTQVMLVKYTYAIQGDGGQRRPAQSSAAPARSMAPILLPRALALSLAAASVGAAPSAAAKPNVLFM